MIDFFGFNKKQDNANQESVSSTLARLQTFLDKLDQRAQEITEEVKESAQIIADADTDPYKRSFLQFKGAIVAQFVQIIQKASTIYQTKVIPSARGMEMIEIAQVYSAWNERMVLKMENLFHGVLERDLEKEYQLIMEEYNQAKDKFQCKQCGAKLELKQFFFQATYITCDYCQVQNTFDPGSSARSLEHFAHPLARARCKALYEKYQERKRLSGKRQASAEFKTYAQALINEMDLILPGMQQQHQNFHQRLLKDFEDDILPS